MATCEIWLPMRYGYLWDMATCEIWLPVRYGYLWDMATCEILLPTRYCLPATYGYPGYIATCGIYACNMLAITGYLFPVIAPIQRYWLPTWYGCSFAGDWLFEGMRKSATSCNLVEVSITPKKRASIQYQEEAGMWIWGMISGVGAIRYSVPTDFWT